MSRRSAILTLTFCLALTAGIPAQTPRTVYTNPSAPPREELNRLNLDLAWKVALPVSSTGDGISMVQWLDGQVFVQTHSGRLIAIDGLTGEPLWQFTPDRPYTNIYPVDVNARSVFLLNGNKLYSLHRGAGTKTWDYNLNTAPSNAPLAEADRVFVVVGGNRIFNLTLPDPAPVLGVPDEEIGIAAEDRLTTPDGVRYQESRADRAPPSNMPSVQLGTQATGAFLGTNRSPSITALHTLRPPYRLDRGSRSASISVLHTLRPPYYLPDGNATPSISALSVSVARTIELNSISPQFVTPTKTWEHLSPARITFNLLTTRNRLFVPTNARFAFSLDKLRNRVLERYDTRSEIAAQPAVAVYMAYVPDEAGNLTAFNLRTSRRVWRYSGGGTMNIAPVIADDTVFGGGTMAGLSAVDRETGVGLWKSEDAVAFHAANPKFVYASDRHGRLLLLERSRGLELTRWDGAIPFNVPVVNDRNDRLLLAANNGLLLCLRDKSFADPVPLYTPTEAELALDDPRDPAEEGAEGAPMADPPAVGGADDLGLPPDGDR